MVGRAAQGRPWLVAGIAAALAGRPVPKPPGGRALAEMVAGHYDEILEFYGVSLGARVARKHLGWYMDTAGTPPGPRREVLTAESPERVRRLLPGVFDAAGAVAA
jgi:tRNA-dihydrouridine synthase